MPACSGFCSSLSFGAVVPDVDVEDVAAARADGLRVGTVTAVHVRGDHVWVGGEFGLARLASGRFQPVVAVAGAELLGVSGVVETVNGDVWVNGAGGVTRIPAGELRRAVQDSGYRVRAERFDYRDGFEGVASQIRPLPSAVEGSDGRLWFATTVGVAWQP